MLPPSFGVRLMGDGNSTVLQAASRMQNLVHIKGPAYRFLMDCMTIDANNMAEVGIRLDGGYYTVFNSLYVTRPRDMGMHAGSLDQGFSRGGLPARSARPDPQAECDSGARTRARVR